MKKVIVFGTFDLLHDGHLHMLNEAKEYGDYLIVVIARDDVVCKIKGRSAINDEKTRLLNIQKLNLANKVRLGCIDDRYQVIREEKPNIIALGYDQKVFVDKLVDNIDDNVQIVRLAAFNPEVNKSSKIREEK